MSSYFVGVDTGGTFTDLVILDDEGRLWFDKAFSTPSDPSEGVLAVLEQAAALLERDLPALLADTERLAHGTTVSTNALIQRRGARVGLIATRGFEDTSLIARGPLGRAGGLSYDEARDFLHTEPPEPLVPRPLIVGVNERVAPDGRVLAPLRREEVRAVAERLRELGVESVAVCLLWSFRNDAHERLVAETLDELGLRLPVHLSSRVSPLLGEFERTMTTVVNAYIGPVTQRYISRLQRELAERGLRHPVQVMKCSGGLCLSDQVERESVAIVNSGPVGGIQAARYLGQVLGFPNIITTDVGGTSFDVGLIAGGEYEYEQTPFLSQGVPVQMPSVKVVTIGAGGGSIAWTDGTRLRVGPQSAGAEPGPACYGLGGERPTVTDALVVLGLLDPEHFFGGRRRLDRARAEQAIRAHVAEPLGLDLLEAAAGIYQIVTARMTDLVRKVTIESGYDPREFVLFSYGGAGPAHAAVFGHELGVQAVVVPPTAAVFSALGIALSDVLYTHARSEPLLLEPAPATLARLNETFAALVERAEADLARSGAAGAEAVLQRRLELRYVGQMNEVSLEWGAEPFTAETLPLVRERFEALYRQRYGQGTTRAESPLEIISFRVDALRRTTKPPLRPAPAADAGPARPDRERPLYQRGAGFLTADVYDFDRLAPGQELAGPAIVEHQDTTIYVPPGQVASVDAYRNVVIRRR